MSSASSLPSPLPPHPELGLLAASGAASDSEVVGLPFNFSRTYS